MTLFDPTSLRTVTRLVDRAGWSTVYVGRRRVARVPSKRAAGLGIAVGVEWTEALAHAAELASETVKAKKKAVALLRVKDRTEQELRDRLLRAGFGSEGVEAALAELTREGLVDDARLAQVSVARDLERGRSIAAAAARLETRGVRAADIPPTGGAGELARAVAAAQKRAQKLPESLPMPAKARRLLAALARLGYEEETAREAAERVLGFIPPDQESI